MSPLHRLRARAFRLGVAITDYIYRVQTRELQKLDGYADEDGTIRFRPRVACKRALPGWQPVFKTLTT